MGDADGTRFEDWLPLARDLHPVLDVRARLLLGERPQVISRGDPLGELTQLRPGEELRQLGLADQDDLEELLPRRLEVRQQPDLLEHLGAEVLRLVDDQHGPTPAPVRVEQGLGERVDEDLEARRAGGIGDPELVTHDREQLDRRQPGIEDHGDIDVGRQLLEQGAAHRGLPCANLPRQLHDAPATPDSVEQMGESLAVRVAQIEVAWIGREGERPLGEAEVRGIHGWGRS